MIAIIPARFGSEGVKDKNWRACATSSAPQCSARLASRTRAMTSHLRAGMTGTTRAERRCGTCRWWDGMSTSSGYFVGEGKCNWPEQNLPVSLKFILRDIEKMDVYEGTTCPTWEAREPEGGTNVTV